MKKARTLAAATLALAAASAAANDSILYTKAEYALGHRRFYEGVLASPALKSLSKAPSYSEITLNGMSEPASAQRIPQLGDGSRMFSVNASSFQHLGKGTNVWGEASYENGRRYDVRWNETSDFLLLYPYVMADGKGGDTKYEEYKLNGGFSARHSKILYGAELGYRALSEYRDRDPRPNNTVADLYARLGFGYNLFANYVVALSADAGKYKQTNELTFYNELGAQMEYHLTGIGNHFARFSGLSNNCFYKGYNLGAQLSLANATETGWTASAGYMYTRKEKILSDLNRLPLNQLDIYRVNGSVAYNTAAWGARLSTIYSDRQGTDNLFGDATGNIYPQIGSEKQYSAKHATVTANGFWTCRPSKGVVVNIEPEVAYSSFKSSHKSSANVFNSSDLSMQLAADMSFITGGNMFSANASIGRRQNMSTDVSVFSSVSDDMTATLTGIGDYLRHGETTMSVGADYSRKIFGNKALGVGFRWRHCSYLAGSCNGYEAQLSFSL